MEEKMKFLFAFLISFLFIGQAHADFTFRDGVVSTADIAVLNADMGMASTAECGPECMIATAEAVFVPGICTGDCMKPQKFVAMEKNEHGIIDGAPRVEYAKDNHSCHINFRIHQRRNFQNSFNANRWCDDIHRRGFNRNFCFVRGWSDNFFEASFRYHGQGRGNSFGDIFNNIYNFGGERGFFDNDFQFDFYEFGGGGQTCFRGGGFGNGGY
jgi:hypothetical protein